jgi:hypothetical protein
MRELKDYGLKPGANELVQLRGHGVTPEYSKGLKDAGYGSLRVDNIVRLRDHGVNTNFARDRNFANSVLGGSDCTLESIKNQQSRWNR